LKRLDELGYDGVEIWAQAFEAGGIEGVEAAVAPHSFEVASVNPYFDFTSAEESYERSLNLAAEYTGYARRLGCSRIRTFASMLGSFTSSREAKSEHWERAINGIRELCNLAAPHGIRCVMELYMGGGQLFDTSDATLRILRGVNRPNLTLNLRPPLPGESIQESVERLGPYITHLHANNWKGAMENYVYLDEGDIDFGAYLAALCRHGFDGYVSIEHAHRDPFGFAEHNIGYLRKLIREVADRR
jgi:sugar phosphate isomerase/epimerase